MLAKALLDQSAEFGGTDLQFLTSSRDCISFASARDGVAPPPVLDSAKRTLQPVFYLDTNIMVDVLKERNVSSIKLVQIINKNRWKCVTSAFAFMEMVDTIQDYAYAKARYQAKDDYVQICRGRHCRTMPLSDLQSIEFIFHDFYQQYPFICPVSLDATGWDLALHITSSTNIFAPDAIHLATAWMCRCDLLISNDSPFVSESKKLLGHENVSDFAVCPADMAEKTMREMGFEVAMYR